jgi:hypothetical protein
MDNEITLIVQDDEHVRIYSNDGAEKVGRLEINTIHRNLIRIFVDWLKRDKITNRQECEAFGSLLYQTLFSDDIEGFFEKKLYNIQKNDHLRIQLCFQKEAADLAKLPWEFLYFPDKETRKGFFISTNSHLVLSRYIPLEHDRKSLDPGESPLRILIVVSQPEDLGKVIAEPVIKSINELPEVVIDILNKPTVDNFLDKIERIKPHVLHFIGHGRFNNTDSKGEIGLLGPDKKTVQWINDRDFAEYFVNLQSIPHLIFLHLCEGAAVDFNANFAGMAPQLMRADIQALVAMQFPITNQKAISFSKAFYGKIAKGEPIDHAVQYGRWRLTTEYPESYGSRNFGSPVLYMHSRDGIIQLNSENLIKANLL